jgi:CRISPR-associated endonuclease/helicase Cas3
MANSSISFRAAFKDLTGHDPFPWQQRLFDRLIGDDIPSSCNLPTGLGKTNVIAIWLIALAKGAKLPRRLVYVVNRRTVVDQTTSEVEKIRRNIEATGIADALRRLCRLDNGEPALAISTLRGQFADNREWSANPSRPAVICGTVDMIGSRLLFSGYGVGFKSRPLHAGFLGQDALLVHDEAHLEPAFQSLITDIEKEQTRERERSGDLPWPKLCVMALSATARNEEKDGETRKPFELTPEENSPPVGLPNSPSEPIHHVWRRLKAKKTVSLHPVVDGKDAVAKDIARLATAYKGSNAAVLVFVRTLDEVGTIEKELIKTKRKVVLLTGTMRGKERDDLVEQPEFKRFLKDAQPGETVYLVCTSAGEVGIDISADHLVCDLSTFESMAQRFGRVNRYGDGDARIDVVHPASFGKVDKKTGELRADEIDRRRQKTLDLLRDLPSLGKDTDGNEQYDASPKALGELKDRITPQQLELPVLAVDDGEFQRVREDLANKHITSTFAPEPTILPATDILFDAWALTSIRQPMPGRQPVEPYLHGIRDYELPETQVAWREEVGIITRDLLDEHPPEDMLDEYPLKPHELLRGRTDRVLKELQALAQRSPDAPVWIVDEWGKVTPRQLRYLIDPDKKRVQAELAGTTVLLPHDVGGLTKEGMLDGDFPLKTKPDESPPVINNDVANLWLIDRQPMRQRTKLTRGERVEVPPGMKAVYRIPLYRPEDDEDAPPAEEWVWFVRITQTEADARSRKTYDLAPHLTDARDAATRVAEVLPTQSDERAAVLLAARFHDLGKDRERWQRMIGNSRYPECKWAKGRRWSSPERSTYRHEFGSMLDVRSMPEFEALSSDAQELVLHLIAAHHGRARPHFTPEESLDDKHDSTIADEQAVVALRRFARLQRKYGRWGLAYIESLLRAADYAASAKADNTQGGAA